MSYFLGDKYKLSEFLLKTSKIILFLFELIIKSLNFDSFPQKTRRNI